MKSTKLLGSLALTLTLAACASPVSTTSNATGLSSPHVFAHDHVLDVDSTDAISDKLWAQYNYQIAKLMGNAEGPSVQILPTALAVSPTATADGLDIQSQLEVFAGNIPEWNAVYEASSYKVLDAYREVLMQIKPAPDASAELQEQFATQQKAADAAAKAVSTFKLGKLKDWKDQNDEYNQYGLDPVTFPDFLKDFQGEFDGLVAKNKLEADKLQRLVEAQPKASTFVDALVKLNDELNSDRIAPQYVFNPNIGDMIGQWTSTGAYEGKPAGALAPASFKMANTSESTDYSKTTWAARGSGGGWFWRASGSTSGSTESLVSNKSTYDMSVNFQSTALVLATAKNINTVFLNEYKNGPWIDGSMIGTGKTQAFGQNGLFPMLITEMLVVYNPSITMKMDESSYKYAKTTMQAHASGGGGWGPFSYGGSADSSYTHVKTNFDDANASVTIQDVSNVPKIVAVRAHIMP